MKIPLQQYANDTLSAEWQMPLMTIEEACAKIGWQFEDRPKCCGTEVKLQGFLGSIYQGWCEKCGKFVFDVTGPKFGNSWVNLIDSEQIDVETDFARRWISGTKVDLASPKKAHETDYTRAVL